MVDGGWWMVVTMMVTIFLNSSRAGISTPMLVQCQALKEHGSGLIEVHPWGMTDQSSFFQSKSDIADLDLCFLLVNSSVFGPRCFHFNVSFAPFFIWLNISQTQQCFHFFGHQTFAAETDQKMTRKHMVEHGLTGKFQILVDLNSSKLARSDVSTRPRTSPRTWRSRPT